MLRLLLCITNNSIKHQSFIYTYLNNSVKYKPFGCTHFKCQIVLFNPELGPYHVLPHRVRMDLGARAMKGYFAFPKAHLLLEPHQQIFSVISGHALMRSYSLQRSSRCTLQPQSSGLVLEVLGL